MQLNRGDLIRRSSRSSAATSGDSAGAGVPYAPLHGHPEPSASAPSFRVGWARSADDVAEAQRLRFRVFAGEMGASLGTDESGPDARDIDEFDAYCDHLLVRANGGPQHGEVVATCRVLSPDGAKRVGRLYTDSAFDLSPVRDWLPQALEMGRVCVDAEWRNGLVVMALWRELGKRMADQKLDKLIGCSSVGLGDGGDLAIRLWHRLKQRYLVASGRQVRPWHALALASEDRVPAAATVAVPALIKGYLRCGGKLLGPPAIDVAFKTADFPMLMQLDDLPSRYGKRIFGVAV